MEKHAARCSGSNGGERVRNRRGGVSAEEARGKYGPRRESKARAAAWAERGIRGAGGNGRRGWRRDLRELRGDRIPERLRRGQRRATSWHRFPSERVVAVVRFVIVDRRHQADRDRVELVQGDDRNAHQNRSTEAPSRG